MVDHNVHNCMHCMQQFLFPVLIIFLPKWELCTIFAVASHHIQLNLIVFDWNVSVPCCAVLCCAVQLLPLLSNVFFKHFSALWLHSPWAQTTYGYEQHSENTVIDSLYIISSSKMEYPFNLHSFCGYWQCFFLVSIWFNCLYFSFACRLIEDILKIYVNWSSINGIKLRKILEKSFQWKYIHKSKKFIAVKVIWCWI